MRCFSSPGSPLEPMNSVPNTLIDQRQSLNSRPRLARRRPKATDWRRSRVGFPIRKSMDQCLFAAPHGLSQRTTSFIASQRQGIHQIPLRHLIALIIDARPRPIPEGSTGRHRRVATARRCEAAIKTYAFVRTCPGREAVKLPVITPEGSIEPHTRHLATRGVNSIEFGVESTRRLRATRRASPVARPGLTAGHIHSSRCLRTRLEAQGPRRCASRTRRWRIAICGR